MNANSFPPPKQRGLLVHGIALLLFVAVAGVSFFQLASLDVGSAFLIWLLIAIVAVAPIPFLAYRLFALQRADYEIDRDSLLIRWGLRAENIPLSDIEWIRPADDLTVPLKLPPLSLPGALLGTRRHPDLNLVEFVASDAKKMLLVATAKRVFVISPQDPAALTQTFARAAEMGSLISAQAQSVYPSFVVSQAWRSGLARYLWLTALFLNVGLFVWVSMIIPSTPQVALVAQTASGFESVPSSQLIVFPLASLLLSVVGWVGGLSLYRREIGRALAFILWGSSALTALLFLLSALFVVTTPV
ncbi:MAG: PH domain-containing protein [Anaerolineales bacterium]|nr:PH domain-containing protein [Anaerolineales bacterium]